jgi:uncharacterized surface anchored protein
VGRLHVKLIVGVAFLFLIAAAMWFASPTSQVTSAPLTKYSYIKGAYLPPGKIKILKIDNTSGSVIGLPGTQFTISPDPNTGVNGSSLTVTDNVSPDTDTNLGIIQLENVPVGTYDIVEVAAPTGYQINKTHYTVNVQQDATITVSIPDTKIPFGIILIEKRDKDTGAIVDRPGVAFTISPDPNTGLPGSKLTVVDNSPPDTNPAYGIIQVNNIPLGSYIVIEVAPPSGYLIDSTQMTANVQTGGATVTVTSRDLKEPPKVPASSNISIGIMIGLFATLIGFVSWRSRRKFSALGR